MTDLTPLGMLSLLAAALRRELHRPIPVGPDRPIVASLAETGVAVARSGMSWIVGLRSTKPVATCRAEGHGAHIGLRLGQRHHQAHGLYRQAGCVII